MTKRETMKMRPAADWASVSALPTGLLDRLWDAFHNKVVEGYQDEDGFHYGAQTAPTKSNWPPSV